MPLRQEHSPGAGGGQVALRLDPSNEDDCGNAQTVVPVIPIDAHALARDSLDRGGRALLLVA